MWPLPTSLASVMLPPPLFTTTLSNCPFLPWPVNTSRAFQPQGHYSCCPPAGTQCPSHHSGLSSMLTSSRRILTGCPLSRDLLWKPHITGGFLPIGLITVWNIFFTSLLTPVSSISFLYVEYVRERPGLTHQYIWCLEDYLEQNRCSITIFGMNE